MANLKPEAVKLHSLSQLHSNYQLTLILNATKRGAIKMFPIATRLATFWH